MIKELCPELKIDYSEISDVDADKSSNVYLTLKNPEIFQKGCYDL